MKIIICGANGRMGQTLAGVIAHHPDAECVAGVDLFPDAHTNAFPVFRHISDFTGEADMIIDFSRPATLHDNLDYALAHQTPIVIATTGYSKKDRELIQQSARHIPVFFTANMSLGVNLQMDLCRQAAAFYGSAVDIEIIEKHHNQKVDAPSGTALALADTINSAYGGNLEYQFGRHGTNCKRTDSEIGIHAIRGGSIVGEHEVLFINDDEIIEITHRSRTRQVFATGAVRAAFFLANLPAGLYSMQDIVFETRTITNILVDDRQALISIANVPHDIHIISDIFEKLANLGIIIDIISQSAPKDQAVDISFSLPERDVTRALEALAGFEGVRCQTHLAKLTISGAGMEKKYGVASSVFSLLAKRNIEIAIITTSETKISLCVDKNAVETAKEVIQKAFNV